MDHPKRYIYLRCSTDSQDYAQQQQTIYDYFARMGISQDAITAIYKEKVSGLVKHTERKLADLLEACADSDYIYVSELSRLGRSMVDIFAIVNEASGKGVTIIQCKDGSAIEGNSIGGKALLFALGLAAELEASNIRQRTRSALRAIQLKHERGEVHISKAGNVCTHLGREKGCDNSKATAASAIAKQARAEEWRKNSIGYQSVIRWLREGQGDEFIISEFNAHHAANPKDYSTPKGFPLSLGTLRQWKREIKNMLVL